MKHVEEHNYNRSNEGDNDPSHPNVGVQCLQVSFQFLVKTQDSLGLRLSYGSLSKHESELVGVRVLFLNLTQEVLGLLGLTVDLVTAVVLLRVELQTQLI